MWHRCDRVCHWHDEEIQSILCNITHSLKVNLLPTHMKTFTGRNNQAKSVQS